MEKIEISQTEEDAQAIRERLKSYNNQFAPPDEHENLSLIVKRNGEVIGGLLGGFYWNWLHIDWFWVAEDARNTGLGGRILEAAEQMAVRKGCRNAHLETHDFQSLSFYQRRGYQTFGKLEDLPIGHTKYYLFKNLDSSK
jgi:GNAT superfamily N-acetyltransferase